jgi:hypothetical protein
MASAALIAGMGVASCGGGGHSLSYKDGYAWAKNDYNSPDGSTLDITACLHAQRFMPKGDMASDWSTGCVNGFKDAQNKADHPGLQNSGSTP